MNAKSTNPTQIVKTSHYNWHPSGIECRQLVRFLPYNLGTAVAYVWRAGRKSGVPAWDDLRKAAQHLDYIAQSDEASLFHETRGFDPRTGDLVERIERSTHRRELWLREILFLISNIPNEITSKGVRDMLGRSVRFLRNEAESAHEGKGAVDAATGSPKILFTGVVRVLYMHHDQAAIKAILAVGLNELSLAGASSFGCGDVVNAALKSSNSLSTIDPDSAGVCLAIMANDPHVDVVVPYRKIRKVADEPEALWAFAEEPDQTSQSSQPSQSPSESSPSKSSSSR